jgi:catechol 2,3-dioxygenase-like lactoylglutathione lyase family enzyme
MPDHAQVIIALDVADLDRSVDFYATAMGLRVVRTERPGLIFESRVLAGPGLPALALHIRKQFGIRVTGSHPGQMLRVSLRVDDPSRYIEAVDASSGRWIGPKPAPGVPHIHFVDPDGYEYELFTEPAPLVATPKNA